MPKIKLIIRDANVDLSGIVSAVLADQVIAALSADPLSLPELNAALDRFTLESPSDGYFSDFDPRVDQDPLESDVVIIDLPARLVVINSTECSAGQSGAIRLDNIECLGNDSLWLDYQCGEDWLFAYNHHAWEAIAEARRRARMKQHEPNVRVILYGEPMLRSIIQGCRRQFANRHEIASRFRTERLDISEESNERFDQAHRLDLETETLNPKKLHDECSARGAERMIYHNTLRDIHADWLMAPCRELGGQQPRAVLLKDHDRLSRDMFDREQEWRVLGRCSPGIGPESYAFQFGGFNTGEIVLYYEYVRLIAWACWDGLEAMTDMEWRTLNESQSAWESFLRGEVIRLQRVGEQWLDSPWEDDPKQTPRGIIHLERQRIPRGGPFEPIDPECPCCQAMARMHGIGFWHLDGCNMDDLFAFDFSHESLESWQQERATSQRFDEHFDQSMRLTRQWGLPYPHTAFDPSNADVWRLVVSDHAGVIPVGPRLLDLAHTVVSLVVHLQAGAEHHAGHSLKLHSEALTQTYWELQKACEESTESKLAVGVPVTLDQLHKRLTELSPDLEAYLQALAPEAIESMGDRPGVDRGDYQERYLEDPPMLFAGQGAKRDVAALRNQIRKFTDQQLEVRGDEWLEGDGRF